MLMVLLPLRLMNWSVLRVARMSPSVSSLRATRVLESSCKPFVCLFVCLFVQGFFIRSKRKRATFAFADHLEAAGELLNGNARKIKDGSLAA